MMAQGFRDFERCIARGKISRAKTDLLLLLRPPSKLPNEPEKPEKMNRERDAADAKSDASVHHPARLFIRPSFSASGACLHAREEKICPE